MAKGAEAECPVCRREVSDPDYDRRRPLGRVLKCSNCLNKLEWERAWWDRPGVIEFFLFAITTLAWTVGKARLRGEPLHRLGDYGFYILGVLALVRYALEKMGVLRPRLRVTDRSYVDRDALMRGAGGDPMAARPARAKKRWSSLRSMLRGQTALPLEEPLVIDTESKK